MVDISDDKKQINIQAIPYSLNINLHLIGLIIKKFSNYVLWQINYQLYYVFTANII